MAYRKFSSSRARLTAILLTIFIPIGAVMSVAAWTNYRLSVAAIERNYGIITSFLASRFRIWVRSAERSLATAAASLGEAARSDEECREAARRIIGSVPGYAAIAFRGDQNVACSFARDDALTAAQLDDLHAKAREGIPYRPAGAVISETRLHFDLAGASHLIAVQADAPPGSAARWSAMLLVDPQFLNATMSFGDPYPRATVATMLTGGRIVSVFGAEARAEWLPSRDPEPERQEWEAAGRDGRARIYARSAALGDDISVLAAFPDDEVVRARWHLLLLLVLPFAILGSLALVFIRATDVYVLRWLGFVEHAARERAMLRPARVAMSNDMPEEIRSFSAAFNEMAQAEETRRAALEKALNENRFLVRELHHRVKNSLQVIQSYIAIEARGQTGPAHAVLVDAELRVKIMAIAYRIAMAEGTIRAVDLNDFLSHAMQVVSTHLRPGQIVQPGPAEGPVLIELEKVIALGFLFGETIIRAGRAAPRFVLTVRIVSDEEGDGVVIESDPRIVLGAAPRINRGLMLQLGARPLAGTDTDSVIAGWRWRRG